MGDLMHQCKQMTVKQLSRALMSTLTGLDMGE